MSTLEGRMLNRRGFGRLMGAALAVRVIGPDWLRGQVSRASVTSCDR